MMFDILIKNGTVFDGENEPRQLDVGIQGERIKAIGNLAKANAVLVIDASKKFVTPGFVDIQNHSDAYQTLLESPRQESLVGQGVTTIAIGQCGTSLAPLAHPDAFKSLQKWRGLAGVNFDWLTFGEFLTSLDKYRLGVNVASLVGHATMRRGLIGDQARGATVREVEIMSKILGDSLEAGAAGLSMGLMYAHEAASSEIELVTAAKQTGDSKKLVSVHLRSDGSQTVAAVQEAIGIATTASCRLKISHLKIRGERNWGMAEEVHSLLDRAYQQGLDVFFDAYPYTSSWSVLYTYLPKWAYEGGKPAILRNLRSNPTRDRILGHLRDQEHDLSQILVASSEVNPEAVGKTLGQVARDHESSVEDALVKTLLATETQVTVFDHNLSSDVQDTFLKSPLSVIASDGAGYNYERKRSEKNIPHPRCFGAFPKFLSMVRERQLMPWNDAIKKITSRPAEKLNLKSRGKLGEGLYADMAVFDPETVASRATYENPYGEPIGIEYVFVNGKVAHGKPEAQLAGRVLRI